MADMFASDKHRELAVVHSASYFLSRTTIVIALLRFVLLIESKELSPRSAINW